MSELDWLDTDEDEWGMSGYDKGYTHGKVKNKIADVAKLFGKDLGEDFTINFYGRLFDVVFDEGGLRVFSDTLFEDELSRLLLESLILGNAVIVGDGTKKC